MRARPLVLIVEDEPDLLALLRVILESNGYDTALAADGAMALQRFDAERPDIVLLDLMLPVKDGWTVLEEMGSRPSPPPVIVCSAVHDGRTRELAVERGVAGFLTKPLDKDVLLDTIDGIVADRRRWPMVVPLRESGREPPLSGVQPA